MLDALLILALGGWNPFRASTLRCPAPYDSDGGTETERREDLPVNVISQLRMIYLPNSIPIDIPCQVERGLDRIGNEYDRTIIEGAMLSKVG